MTDVDIPGQGSFNSCSGLKRRLPQAMLLAMDRQTRLQLDMSPDGEFRTPPRAPLTSKIFACAVLIAVIAGGLAFAAFALWVALLLIPVVILAVLVAVLTLRFRLWQARHRAGRSPATTRYRW